MYSGLPTLNPQDLRRKGLTVSAPAGPVNRQNWHLSAMYPRLGGGLTPERLKNAGKVWLESGTQTTGTRRPPSARPGSFSLCPTTSNTPLYAGNIKCSQLIGRVLAQLWGLRDVWFCGLAAEMCVWDRCVDPGLGPVMAGPAVAEQWCCLGASSKCGVQSVQTFGLYDHILLDCQGKRLPWQSNSEMATGPRFVGYEHLDAKLTKNRLPCQLQKKVPVSHN